MNRQSFLLIVCFTLFFVCAFSKIEIKKKHFTKKNDPVPSAQPTTDVAMTKEEIYKTKQELEELKAKYQKAEQIFMDKPEGRDKYGPEIYEGGLYVRVEYMISATKNKVIPLDYHHFRINDNAIYYSDKDRQYRGILGALSFDEILNKNDNTLTGQCCNQVGKLETRHQKKGDATIDYQCFKVKGKQEIWTLCHQEVDAAHEWRNELIKHIIAGDLKKKGITDVNPMTLAADECTAPGGYSWGAQQKWPCLCESGQEQSPIRFQDADAVPKNSMHLKWMYKDAENAKASYDGKQVTVKADFGSLEFKDSYGTKHFKAEAIQFKFRAEHQINNVQASAEMIVHHTSTEGEKAIMSVFILNGDESTANLTTENPNRFHELYQEIFNKGRVKLPVQENDFIDSFQFDAWPNEKDNEVCIDTKINLMKVYADNDGNIDRDNIGYKNFYYYKGSNTSPPCYEDVHHYIMMSPLVIPKSELDKLQQKSYDQSESKNSRDPRERFDRQVLKHVEAAKSCEELDVKQIQEAVNDIPQQQPMVPHKFIKANSQFTSYGIVTPEGENNMIYGDLGNGITIEKVDNRDDVPNPQRDKLYKEFETRQNVLQEFRDKVSKQNDLEETQDRINSMKNRIAELDQRAEANGQVRRRF